MFCAWKGLGREFDLNYGRNRRDTGVSQEAVCIVTFLLTRSIGDYVVKFLIDMSVSIDGVSTEILQIFPIYLYLYIKIYYEINNSSWDRCVALFFRVAHDRNLIACFRPWRYGRLISHQNGFGRRPFAPLFTCYWI